MNVANEKVINDLLRPIGYGKGFLIWMSFLTAALVACLYAYVIQLKVGLGVTGLRDYVSWGIYIANFVFFVATSLIGMLISAVLGLTQIKWASPLARIAEIISLAFAAVAGLVIISDMGRPDRFLYLFFYGRIQSPIIWDVTVVTTYVVISTLLLYLPMIPDIALCRDRLTHVPKWQRKLYEILSVNWQNSENQQRIIRQGVKTLLILIIPVALAIHTVTSWLFAVTHRPGWDSTIFGPYFVTGAFVSGTAAVIIAMYVFRKIYHLEQYITVDLFDKIGKLLVLVSLVYLYFNINEYLVPVYKLKHADAAHLHELFQGRFAVLYWSVQLGGLLLPIILLLFKPMRKPLPLLIVAIFVIIGAWFKRYLIVIPTMQHPFLPIQNVPIEYQIYKPTLIEIAITIAPIILVLMIITVLSKTFPVLPIQEVESHEDN
ncbi:MAG: NrfD/PsrC family molybdoenzyme membrane anchor subunit [Bacteroidales bacterium]|nr:polysulfide reductase NrfD [Bacteroidales bacterium]HOK99475.1 polysulfide reductase NrfD [Bacteroidales bacterium]HPO65719.1 polysulfide reductase NrfD [Bacteroidales bacterium]